MIDLALYGLAAVGVAASIVTGVKVVTKKTFDESINIVCDWVKDNSHCHEMFYLESVPIFVPGLEDIVQKYSSLPFELTSRFPGTTGTFDYYRVQVFAVQSKLAIFEKALYNLVYKTLIHAGFQNFKIIVISDIQNNNTGEAIVTVYYALINRDIQALNKWYLKQVDVQRTAITLSPAIDEMLEKDLEENGC